jgi:hypothetical protein
MQFSGQYAWLPVWEENMRAVNKFVKKPSALTTCHRQSVFYLSLPSKSQKKDA